jgi:hypothetical protein
MKVVMNIPGDWSKEDLGIIISEASDRAKNYWDKPDAYCDTLVCTAVNPQWSRADHVQKCIIEPILFIQISIVR